MLSLLYNNARRTHEFLKSGHIFLRYGVREESHSVLVFIRKDLGESIEYSAITIQGWNDYFPTLEYIVASKDVGEVSKGAVISWYLKNAEQTVVLDSAQYHRIISGAEFIV